MFKKRKHPNKPKDIPKINPVSGDTQVNMPLETIPDLKVSPEIIPASVISYKCDVTRCKSQAEVFANGSKYCKLCAKDRGL